MMDYRLRLWFGLLVLFLSVLAHACSSSAPDDNPKATPAPPAYEGFVATINCNGVGAWGWDMVRPNDPIKLDFYDGDVLVDTVTADLFGEDLLKAGKGNGKHYANWPTVKFGGTAVQLPLARTGPREAITCNPGR